MPIFVVYMPVFLSCYPPNVLQDARTTLFLQSRPNKGTGGQERNK